VWLWRRRGGRGRMPRRGVWTTQREGEQSPVSHTSHPTAEATVCLCVARPRRGAARSEARTVVLLDVAGDPSPRLRLGWLRQRERGRGTALTSCVVKFHPFCLQGQMSRTAKRLPSSSRPSPPSEPSPLTTRRISSIPYPFVRASHAAVAR
jgi:hypothetical protein